MKETIIKIIKIMIISSFLLLFISICFIMILSVEGGISYV